MTTNGLEAAAKYLFEELMRRHPAQAAALATLILHELLAVTLHGEDSAPADVDVFVAALNARLAAMALEHGADRAWQLVAVDPD